MAELRDRGAQAVVALIAFAMSFFALGMAIPTLPGGIGIEKAVLFSFGTVSLISSICVALAWSHDISRRAQQRREIAGFLRQAYTLRTKVLAGGFSVESEGIAAIELWTRSVADWLHTQVPDQAPDFGLDTIQYSGHAFIYDDMDRALNEAVLSLEGRTVNLRDILRDLRL